MKKLCNHALSHRYEERKRKPINNKNYSVARVEQHTKTSIGKSERHIERKNESYENMNVDLSRTHLNIHFKSCGDLTYSAQLNKLIEDGSISLRGLKKDAKVFDEMIFDVNTGYFEERSGYEYARQFYEEAFRFAQKEYGPENIVSAVMHADELNTALTEQLGHPVYHYHMHVIALPVVDKEIRWTKRCKDPALVGTVKEVVHQISHSKKWASQKTTDGNGHAQIIKSYSLLQDRFFEHMRDAGFEDFERGERGSTAQHLSVMDFKVKKEESRLEKLENVRHELICDLDEIETREADARQKAAAAEKRAAEIVPKVQKLEEVAQKYAGDAEEILPQPDMLESARSYREKKAKPALKRFQKLYLILYNAYYDLKRAYYNLQRELSRALGRIGALDATIDRMAAENAKKSLIVEKYETLCRGFGRDLIEDRVQKIREREAFEKQQRKAAHQRREVGAR